MQAVLDVYMEGYNQRRTHQGRGMNGRTPTVVFVESLPKPQQQKEDKRAERKTTKQAAHRRPLIAPLSADYPLCTVSARPFHFPLQPAS
jgi:hypothetical protein